MLKSSHVSVVIVAGGQGTRFSENVNKVHFLYAGKPMVEYSLETFQSIDFVTQIVLVGQGFSNVDRLYRLYPKLSSIVPGGEFRQMSVYLGLVCVTGADKVFIHDAARPFFTKEMAIEMVEKLGFHEGVIPLLPIYDAIKTKKEDGSLIPYTECQLWRTQTPQLYQKEILMEAFLDKIDSLDQFRDEMELIKAFKPDASITNIIGDYMAEKITTPADLRLLDALHPKITKTGIGYDFHPFVTGRPLILGGCHIPYQQGLEGDSDGDVLTHSILDSLLGALSKGDIGTYMGIKTEKVMGAKSIDFLSTLLQDPSVSSFKIIHLDSTLVCKEPILSPWIKNMVECIAEVLNIDSNQINIKSTTDKGYDAAGEGTGVRAITIATIEQLQRRK